MSEAKIRESLWPQVMNCYDLTLSTPEENLALDEALLAEVENNSITACLRLWQPSEYCVVLGRSNSPQAEVDVERCAADRIPILRRASGGGTVMIGPGCLCYSLVLPTTELHRSMGVSEVTAELMSKTAAGLCDVHAGVDVNGTSDLVWHGLKFSGNAQRWLRRSFIHHGTILFDFELSFLERYLRHPTREPSYRKSRPHSEFVGNFVVQTDQLKNSFRSVWNAVSAECPASVLSSANQIAISRYGAAVDWKI